MCIDSTQLEDCARLGACGQGKCMYFSLFLFITALLATGDLEWSGLVYLVCCDVISLIHCGMVRVHSEDAG
jgi:hypothetical protein